MVLALALAILGQRGPGSLVSGTGRPPAAAATQPRRGSAGPHPRDDARGPGRSATGAPAKQRHVASGARLRVKLRRTAIALATAVSVRHQPDVTRRTSPAARHRPRSRQNPVWIRRIDQLILAQDSAAPVRSASTITSRTAPASRSMAKPPGGSDRFEDPVAAGRQEVSGVATSNRSSSLIGTLVRPQQERPRARSLCTPRGRASAGQARKRRETVANSTSSPDGGRRRRSGGTPPGGCRTAIVSKTAP